ncbi:hypothetical protein F5146DRAFT_1226077 [Armillaria mellea]|nr:hypothetical protein F5146DRAFT_1226077 [Armillaria mellea]
MNSANDRTNQDLDPQTFKPASLLQGIHFNTTALLCPPVLLKTQRVLFAVRIPLTPAQLRLPPASATNSDLSPLPNIHYDDISHRETLPQLDRSNIEPSSSLDDEDAVHAILVPNTTMSLSGNLVPSTPMPPDDTLAGSLAYTLPPATGFPEIQGWTKLGTAINLSNLVECSHEVLSEPKCLLYTVNPSFPGDQIMLITDALTNAIQGLTRNVNICLLPLVLTRGAAKNEHDVQPGAEPFLFCLSNITTNQKNCLISQQCWSTDAITFFIIPFNPKPLTYITIIHKLTHPDTKAGTRGVSGVVKTAIHDSPEVNAFITANCDALSSSLSPEQAVAVIVNSVMVKKLDLIVTGGQKEWTWAIYAISPTTIFNIHLAWRNLIGTLSFDADLATHGEGIHYPKDLRCMLCYGIDHPTPLCPYPLTTGWHGPIPHAMGRSNTTPTIDFDALQVLDIHHTPAQENQSDRGRGIHGGGRGY